MSNIDTHTPQVTVICTCYNHGEYVQDAILSVVNQTYSNIQLIVIDNASTDNSTEVITGLTTQYPFHFIKNTENLKICKAFNIANKLATGKYLIDLAADDILMPDRIELQVISFEQLDEEYGVIYSNVEEIDKNGTHIKYSINQNSTPPSGDIFAHLLQKYFIPSPSTIFRKTIFDSLGGYNEALDFEDFDFWVQCARRFKFYYLSILSTKKRILSSSLSMQFYSTDSSRLLSSTLQTYIWARERIIYEHEQKAYTIGISYFYRQCILLGHFRLAKKYLVVMSGRNDLNISTIILSIILKVKINPSIVYLFYLKRIRLLPAK